jgi:tRNA(Arg) A34 adenosine deaminase TadA
MIPASYKPKKRFMQLAIMEAKRARDRGDYPIGAVITRLTGRREVVIASAGNRVKTSGSSIKHVELEMLKYVSSGYGRYPARLRAVLYARTLCHVRRRLRVV